MFSHFATRQKKSNNVCHVTQCAARNHLPQGGRCGRTKGQRDDTKKEEETHSLHTTLIRRTRLQTVILKRSAAKFSMVQNIMTQIVAETLHDAMAMMEIMKIIKIMVVIQ